MREAIVFKGDRDGLQLVVDENVSFDEVLKQLKAKLAAAADFFAAGAPIHIYPAVNGFSHSQQSEIAGVLEEYGLRCVKPAAEDAATASEAGGHEGLGQETRALIVNRTLRGGQKVVYHGSVVVIGDVNPNATVVAGGDIIVLGACRGTVHAGAYGDERATVTATKLMAAQIRIAGLIARSPDQADKPDMIETARIKNNTVVIEQSRR
ncbi:MAG: septum site-determining protein MinC [Negativicutes bacterium]|nr:septum site-determining protein MinC [Negativicutes bacterium]